MNPEVKKMIELKKQEALKRLAITKEKQRLEQQNRQNSSSPANKHAKVVNNQRYFPYTPFKPPSASTASSSGQQTVLRNINNKLTAVVSSNAINKPLNSAASSKIPQTGSSSNTSTTNASTSSNRKVRCTFSLISESRFLVKTDVYDPQVIDEFKKIPSKSYSKCINNQLSYVL